jgi:hypothetical protein
MREAWGSGGGGGRERGGRAGRDGTPRVITVESERPVEAPRGHKGELTSLSSLAALLRRGGASPAETPAASPASQEPRADGGDES